MLEYIKKVHGFEDQNITILMDDGQHTEPTSANIIAAYKKIVSESVSGDVVFCHYSGHGGKMRDDDGDEKDGYDETLVPVDYNSAGQIRDDDMFSTLIGPMAKGVVMTCGACLCVCLCLFGLYSCGIFTNMVQRVVDSCLSSGCVSRFAYSDGLLSFRKCFRLAVCVQSGRRTRDDADASGL